ncbi:MAG: hypothetical protein ACE5K7_05965, partial [Phycisphaerae bacterium]
SAAGSGPAGQVHAVAGSQPGDARYPAWLFWVPVAIAYVTAFYMMRCWWLTFMGRPRDRQLYEHAGESPLMYVPLMVLTAGVVVSSYAWFRPMVAEADPGGFLVRTFDGRHGPGMHAAHEALVPIIGLAFVVGFIVAIAIYWRGLEVSGRLAAALRPLHTLLVRKFYFDELYGAVLVGGTLVVAGVIRVFDLFVIDLAVNLAGRITTRLSWLAGWVLDLWGVDGLVNALAEGSLRLAGAVRRPQTGRIRNYVTFAAGAVAVALVAIIFIAG